MNKHIFMIAAEKSRIRSFYLWMLICSLAQVAKLQAAPDAIIPFKTTPTRTLNLHHYRPLDWEASQRLPTIVFWHGGGWQSPNTTQFIWQAEHYRNRGMVAILAEYRVGLVDNSTVESSILDARSAMRHLKANAALYGIDPQKIVAAGGSSGGHLALGCSMFTSYPPEPTDPANVDPTPVATITFNPVVDTTIPDGFGTQYYTTAAQSVLGSPLDQVRPDLPPSLVMHGTADGTIPYSKAVSFKTAMSNAGNNCQLVSYPDQDHSFFRNEPYRTATIVEADAFLESLGITGSLALTGFERWRYAAFGVSGNTGQGADFLDPDNDGFVNVLDYALGGQPLRNDSASTAINARRIGGTMKLTYGHRPDPQLRMNLLHSTDLRVWTVSGTWSGTAWSGNATFKTSLDGDRLLVEARVPILSPPAGPVASFWRLGAWHQPELP